MTTTLPKGYCTSAIGLIVRESVARAIDDAIKDQPSDLRTSYKSAINGHDVAGYCRKGYSANITDGGSIDGAQTDLSFVNTDSLDRDMEVVIPKGLDWSQWSAAPAVCWNHDYERPWVGKGLWVKLAKQDGHEGWLAKTSYTPRPPEHPAGAEWFPYTCWWMATKGYLPGKSIGFLPVKAHVPRRDEIERRPEWKGAKMILDNVLILEYSVLPIQSNPDSLVQGIEKAAAAGIVTKGFTAAVGLVIPPKDETPIVLKSVDVMDADGDEIKCPTCAKPMQAKGEMMNCAEHGDHDKEGEEWKPAKGDVETKAAPVPEPKQAPAAKRIIPAAFVRPETIRDAIAKGVDYDEVTRRAEAKVAAEIDRMLGVP